MYTLPISDRLLVVLYTRSVADLVPELQEFGTGIARKTPGTRLLVIGVGAAGMELLFAL